MPSIRDDLKIWGPDQAPPPPSLAQAEAYCRRLARTHYENFTVVSWLLPWAVQQHLYNVYAFCRWADDLGDELDDRETSRKLLAWWRQELHACYAGKRTNPVFIALGETITEFAIPQEPFDNLISAFEQDQAVSDYETFDQLRDYCRRSADPVGRIVLHLARAATPENLALSDSICTGLQLANFWQDVARDREIGRTYLPREDRVRFGYTDEDLAARATNSAFCDLLRFEVDRARAFLLAGLPLIEAVPRPWQIDIDLFIQGGLTILRKIERAGYHVWEQRPVVTKWDALRLLMGGVGRAGWRRLWRRSRDRAG